MSCVGGRWRRGRHAGASAALRATQPDEQAAASRTLKLRNNIHRAISSASSSIATPAFTRRTFASPSGFPRHGATHQMRPARLLTGSPRGAVFKRHRAFKEIDQKTRRTYEQGLSLVGNHVLKDGARVGTKHLSDFTRAFADAIYAKLLVVEGRRFANSAMVACRRAWFIAQRAEETKVPAINPFSKMGLKARAPGHMPRQTPTATWAELAAFRATAIETGHPSLATAALVAWEWLQREEHLFGAFEARHYRPKERPNSVRIVHPKTGEEAWWPLYDERGEQLFPELTAELDGLKSRIVSGLMIRRDRKYRKSGVPLPWMTARGDLDYLRATVKEIVRAAGLRDDLSFRSFRHGGFTEAADADLTDAQLRAAGRHRSARQLPTYAKRTRKQLIDVARKRRAERTNTAQMSE
jgi:hypothetical protein